MDAIARAVQMFTTVNGQLAQTVRAYAGGELETFNLPEPAVLQPSISVEVITWN